MPTTDVIIGHTKGKIVAYLITYHNMIINESYKLNDKMPKTDNDHWSYKRRNQSITNEPITQDQIA